MEEKFIAAWEQNRAKALLLGVRMRPQDVKGAKRALSGSRLSDGFNDLAAKGVAVIMVSSELPEILSISDRVLVMRRGRINGEFDGATATQEAIMEKAVMAGSEKGATA